MLRESAQTRPEDEAAFGDINRHKFFNTNNLWLDLVALDAVLQANDGVLGLPIIRNVKTVDPADPSSARGDPDRDRDGRGDRRVRRCRRDRGRPRSRFLPVKATSDLLVLRSDAYELIDGAQVRLVPTRTAAPLVDLDKPYKLVDDFDARFPARRAVADRLRAAHRQG